MANDGDSDVDGDDEDCHGYVDGDGHAPNARVDHS